MTGLAPSEDGAAGVHRREAGPRLSKRRRRSLRYGVAVSAAAAGLAVLSLPGIGGSLTDALFFAVLVSAWYGGLGPGLLTTGLMVIAAVMAFALQGRDFPPTLLAQIALFVAGGAVIS